MLNGKRLRTIRESRGFDQYQLAARVGVHNSTISKWETGSNGVRVVHQESLAEALGVRIADFHTSADDPIPPSQTRGNSPVTTERTTSTPNRIDAFMDLMVEVSDCEVSQLRLLTVIAKNTKSVL